MAFIRPEGIISLCDSVPLNPSYDDTFTFKDKTAQYNYFNSKVKKRLQRYSVVRETTAALRVEGNAADYYGYNYMFFCNTNFTDKIFYAFITEAEYVNPNCTLLHFEIDVMQTFLNEYKILPSLVEREHVKDDSLNRNLKPENINVHDRVPFSQPTNMDKLIGQRVFVAGFTDMTSAISAQSQKVPYSPFVQAPKLEKTGPNQYEFISLEISPDVGNTDDSSLLSYSKSKLCFYVTDNYASINGQRKFRFNIQVRKLGGKTETKKMYALSEDKDRSIWYFNENTWPTPPTA